MTWRKDSECRAHDIALATTQAERKRFVPLYHGCYSSSSWATSPTVYDFHFQTQWVSNPSFRKCYPRNKKQNYLVVPLSEEGLVPHRYQAQYNKWSETMVSIQSTNCSHKSPCPVNESCCRLLRTADTNLVKITLPKLFYSHHKDIQIFDSQIQSRVWTSYSS